jgi:hypothetical protein
VRILPPATPRCWSPSTQRRFLACYDRHGNLAAGPPRCLPAHLTRGAECSDRVRASLNAQGGSTGVWRVFPTDIAFDVAVQSADVVIVLLTAEWSASASGRADLNATQGLRLSAHEEDRAKPWQQGSPIVVMVGFSGVDWGSDKVKQLVGVPTVTHDAESLCLGNVKDTLFLLWRLVNQI